jgi:predicted nucleic acid-binding protein
VISGRPTSTTAQSDLVELADTTAWTKRHLASHIDKAFEESLRRGEVSICAPVRHELLVTTRDAAELASSRAVLDTLPSLPVGEAEWRRAEAVLEALARRGPLHHRQVPLPDLLIAAAAESAGVPVLHYDRHFELIASITGQPVHAIAPLGSL